MLCRLKSDQKAQFDLSGKKYYDPLLLTDIEREKMKQKIHMLAAFKP